MTTNDSEIATQESAAGADPADESAAADNGSGAKEARPNKGRKKHGKGFVYVGLKECDDFLRRIDHQAKTMSIDGFAKALGHKDGPKGRFPYKLDALEKFTLIEKDDENVRLTPLATDMLYAGSEAARTKARAMAFLAYPEFKRLFTECPKNQDHPLSYADEFVRGKLGIFNEVDRFLRLFIESAHFAGLLEGEPNPAAKTIRLRHATAPGALSAEQEPAATTERGDGWGIMPLEDVEGYLESIGLDEYRDRSEVNQQTTGRFRLTVGDGKIAVEIDRPVRIVIKPKPNELAAELQQILSAMQQKGLKA